VDRSCMSTKVVPSDDPVEIVEPARGRVGGRLRSARQTFARLSLLFRGFSALDSSTMSSVQSTCWTRESVGGARSMDVY